METKEAYVLYEGDYRNIGRTLLVYEDETDALEAFMSLTEEEMYFGFCGCVDDEMETRTPEEIARDIWYSDSQWFMIRCPVLPAESSIKYARK